MNVYGRLVTVFFASGLVFLALALLRGRLDGAAVIAATLSSSPCSRPSGRGPTGSDPTP